MSYLSSSLPYRLRHPHGTWTGPRVALQRDAILSLVREHGAVLLVSEDAKGETEREIAERFSAVSAALRETEGEDEDTTPDLSCSAGPRTLVAPGVFTSNEAPPSERIPFHHEMAQCPSPPSLVLFCCVVPPREGGGTPLVHSRHAARCLRRSHPEVARRLAREGVRYVRVMPEWTDASSAVGKGWREVFGCEGRREEVEARHLEGKVQAWEWLSDGSLRTVSEVVPALMRVQGMREDEEVFFAAAETTSLAVLDDEDEKRKSSLSTSRPTKSLLVGEWETALDEATRAALRDVGRVLREEQVCVPWRRGDVLVVDNATVQHGREAFVPPRRLLVSLRGSLVKTRSREGGCWTLSSSAAVRGCGGST